MAKSSNATKQKTKTELLEKIQDDKIYQEFLNTAKDELSSFVRHPGPDDLQVGVANKNTMQSFLESDFFELPAGIRCPNCWSFCYATAKSRVKRTTTPTTNNRECLSCAKGSIPTMIQNRKKPINLFVVPPFTSTPINFIITIQRQSRRNTIGAEALQNLRDFISTNEAMPHLSTHVQFIMPPIGSVGSGLASYRDMSCSLKDERETIYSPISSIMFMLTAVMRNGYDKVTLVASKMSSITCKPSNLIQLLEDFKEFKISPKNVSFVLGGFETQEGILSCNPFSLNGEEMMTIFEKKENLPWVNELKLNCFARMFVDGLVSGRNTTKMLEAFLTPAEIIGISKKIAIIQEEDEMEIEE